MPLPTEFELTQESINEMFRALKRGKHDFSWSEDSLLSLIDPPAKRSDIYWATIGLRHCGTLRSIPALKQLAFVPNQDIRACALITIACIAGSSETPYFASCLTDPLCKVKDYAMWAIGVCGDRRALAAVDTYLHKNLRKLTIAVSDPRVQLEALTYLSRAAKSEPKAAELLAKYKQLQSILCEWHRDNLHARESREAWPGSPGAPAA